MPRTRLRRKRNEHTVHGVTRDLKKDVTACRRFSKVKDRAERWSPTVEFGRRLGPHARDGRRPSLLRWHFVSFRSFVVSPMQTTLKLKLSFFMFLQYFIWGSWYVSM